MQTSLTYIFFTCKMQTIALPKDPIQFFKLGGGGVEVRAKQLYRCLLRLNCNKLLTNIPQLNGTKAAKVGSHRLTCRCLCSSLNFSAFALSYSPFSRHLWSGRNLESVGGSFSCLHVKYEPEHSNIILILDMKLDISTQ